MLQDGYKMTTSHRERNRTYAWVLQWLQRVISLVTQGLWKWHEVMVMGKKWRDSQPSHIRGRHLADVHGGSVHAECYAEAVNNASH